MGAYLLSHIPITFPPPNQFAWPALLEVGNPLERSAAAKESVRVCVVEQVPWCGWHRL